jgi:hypothetical protein
MPLSHDSAGDEISLPAPNLIRFIAGLPGRDRIEAVGGPGGPGRMD